MHTIATGEYFLPLWVQIMIGVAAAVVAAGIIWKKLLRPAARLVSLMDKILPLLKELVENFEDTPHAFSVLNDIIREFRTDSGTTLRDVVDRLEKAAKENTIAAQVLATNAETARKLAEKDREIMADLTASVRILRSKQRENIESVDRMEAGDKAVAKNLAASKTRADKVQDGEPGAAADAAVQDK